MQVQRNDDNIEIRLNNDVNGWRYRLMVSTDDTSRRLLTVDHLGVLALPDDLTIAEARWLIGQLVPMVSGLGPPTLEGDDDAR